MEQWVTVRATEGPAECHIGLGRCSCSGTGWTPGGRGVEPMGLAALGGSGQVRSGLVSWGCYNRGPQTPWLNQQTSIVPQFWGPGA